jgi:hypothetical protein
VRTRAGRAALEDSKDSVLRRKTRAHGLSNQYVMDGLFFIRVVAPILLFIRRQKIPKVEDHLRKAKFPGGQVR